MDPHIIRVVDTSPVDLGHCGVGMAGHPGNLRIDLSSLPSRTPSNEGETARFTFSNSIIYSASSVAFQFPNSTFHSISLPFRVVVTNNTFVVGSGLQVLGSIPPNSYVTILANSFHLGADPAAASLPVYNPPPWVSQILSGLAFFPSTADITCLLGRGSRVLVSENLFVGAGDLSLQLTTAGVSWSGGVEYAANTSISIMRNIFDVRCSGRALNPMFDQRACVLGISIPARQIFSESSSSFQIDWNSFNISGGFVAALPPVDFIASGSADLRAVVSSFSHNSGFVNTIGGVGTSFLTAGPVLTSQTGSVPVRVNSVSEISNNSFHVVGSRACGIGFGPAISTTTVLGPPFSGPTVLVSAARIVLSSNMFTSSGCDIQIELARSFHLEDDAQFLVSNNSFSRVDGEVDAESSAIVATNEFSTTGADALFVIHGNAWGVLSANASGPTSHIPTKQLIGTTNFQQAVVRMDVGALRICNNSFYGLALQGGTEDQMVKDLCIPDFARVLGQCSVLPPGGETTLPSMTHATTTPMPRFEGFSTSRSVFAHLCGIALISSALAYLVCM